MIELIASLFIGSIITLICAKYYYMKATKDLKNEASELRRLNELILRGMENAKWVKLNRNEEGKIIGFKFELSSKINATTTTSAVDLKVNSSDDSIYRMVHYSDLVQLDDSSKYFKCAQVHLDCSIHLCQGIIDNSLYYTFSHAMVLLSLFFHSLELFYKGAIIKATGLFPRFDNSADLHNLTILHREFQKYYPEKDFPLSNPMSVKPLGSLDKIDFDEIIYHLPRKMDQQYRYPTDKKGIPWSGGYSLEVNTFKRTLIDYAENYKRLIPLIKTRYKTK